MVRSESTPAPKPTSGPSEPTPTGMHSGMWRRAAGAVVATGLAILIAGCSADDADTVYSDSTEFGPADTVVDDSEVIDGTEGGLDLDNGNVENSTNDDDLDPYDEQLGLNTDETDSSSQE